MLLCRDGRVGRVGRVPPYPACRASNRLANKCLANKCLASNSRPLPGRSPATRW